eukprot:TRINITY_DN15710_c0_g2_i1.p1 TRINITY_DN15710_c0_g2~~TRINITY_DN15710_c0_g2_i1.p1  ORF type:complete len:341 (+),score=52.26 TRINITY_DN15710_c0_g2_i1:99-1121(+)
MAMSNSVPYAIPTYVPRANTPVQTLVPAPTHVPRANTPVQTLAPGYPSVQTQLPAYPTLPYAQPLQPPAQSSGLDVRRLKAVLQRFDVHIADADDLAVLHDYKVVIIADDSSSMLGSAVPGRRKLGEATATRWDELKETTGFIVDIAACFDPAGVDIFFLNRGQVSGVRSSKDDAFLAAFSVPPNGSTPLTQAVRTVVSQCGSERPVLLFIMTDGVPNGGPAAFSQELRRLVKRQSTQYVFKVQIMACTPNDDEVAYLDDLDRELPEIDCTDDYYTEKAQVLRAGLTDTFSRGDWCMKAMLGPVSKKFDAWDEAKSGALMFRGVTANLEQLCSCNLFSWF